METSQVRIGKRFFAGAIKDYNNPYWAFIREALQNSIDSGAQNIDVMILPGAEIDKTTVIVHDDGCGMDHNILVNKLLTLGESGKEFQAGAVGGFGKAKELLFFYHDCYRIETGNLVVEGSGADYRITEVDTRCPGTRITIVWDGNHAERLQQTASDFCRMANWPGMMTVTGSHGTHGIPVETNLGPGTHRRDLDFGQVHTTKAPRLAGQVVIRMRGIPMFYYSTSYKHGVVVELTGNSEERLIANRDGLRYPFSGQLQSFLTQLSVDRRSALRNQNSKYKRYEGEKLRHQTSADPSLVVDAILPANSVGGRIFAKIREAQEHQAAGGGSIRSTTVEMENGPKISLGHEFIIKNTTGMEIPDYFLPEKPEFGDYSRTLAKWWVRLMVLLHEIAGHSASFSVGFILDEDNEAECEQGRYGTVYYLNPAEVVTQDSSRSRSFRKRFKLGEKSRLIALAVHELIHGMGFSRHDEDWSSKMTDVMALVWERHADVMKCFR